MDLEKITGPFTGLVTCPGENDNPAGRRIMPARMPGHKGDPIFIGVHRGARGGKYGRVKSFTAKKMTGQRLFLKIKETGQKHCRRLN